VIVAVTGATGNLGQVVTRQLVDRGHSVRGIARRAPAEGGADTERVEWLRLDLTAPDRWLRLREALDGVDTVVHTAWGFQPTRNTAYLERLDVGGSAAVLDAARAVGVEHLVHISSVGVYSPGAGDQLVTEGWPRGGTPQLPYSRHKVTVEHRLDAHEAQPGHRPVVTRIRPSLMARHDVGGALGRYTLPSLVPAQVVGLLPVLPLDPRFRVQLSHTEDIAAGVVAAVERRATGAFNLAAEPVLRRADIARALDAVPVSFPWSGLRALAAVAWHLRVQPVDPGWLDLARNVPLLSSERAVRELGWEPRHDARDVVAEAVAGIAAQVGAGTPALRPRRSCEQLTNLLRHGPVSRRRTA
jgi:nucleoside-diphosphate-sugar epimerase